MCYRILISLAFFFWLKEFRAQNFAPKKFYLIDSLDLNDVSAPDKLLLDSCLTIFHKAKNDTDKVNALGGICENLVNDRWEDYQYYQYTLIEKAIANSKAPAMRNYLLVAYAKAINNIGIILLDKGDNKTALKLFQKALSIAQRINCKPAIANSLGNIGDLYKYEGQPKKALEAFQKSLVLMQEIGEKSSVATILSNMGSIYEKEGDVPKALDFTIRSLQMREAIGDKRGTAISLSNIGGMYKAQGDLEKAIECYSKALVLQDEVGDKISKAVTMNNFGVISLQKGNISEALDYYNKGLKLQREINDAHGIAHSLNNIASIYEKMNDYKKSEEYYLKSLNIREAIEDRDGISHCLSGIGNLKFKQGNLTEAKKWGLKAYAISIELGFPILIQETTRLLYNIEKKEGHWEQMLNYYIQFMAMRDKIKNEENSKVAIRHQMQYTYDKQKAIVKAQQESELIIAEEKEQQQKVITFSVIIGLTLVLILAAITFNRLRVTNKQKHIIEGQKDLVEEKNHLIEEKQKEIIDSINYAKRIQYALLAHEDLFGENLPEHFVLFNPKDIVSGDFYWATKKDNRFYLAVCDSTGHGVPGAFMSLLNISFLNEAINEKNILAPHLILDHVRRRLIENISKDGGQDGMDAILICIEKNETLKVTYAAANNSPLIVKNNAFYSEEADKMPVGKGERNIPFVLRTLDVKKGDSIYLYTDGFADQFGGPKGKKFKYRQLNELLLSSSAKPMKEQGEILENSFQNWQGELEQVDDVCIIGLKL